jgi:hypothetical protein
LTGFDPPKARRCWPLFKRMSALMPEYRFYRVDEHGYLLPHPEVADCPDDDEAVAHAKQMLTGYVIEVRQGLRLVKRVEPDIPPPGVA